MFRTDVRLEALTSARFREWLPHCTYAARGVFSRTTAAAPLSRELIVGRARNCSRSPDLKLGGFLGSFVFGSFSELSFLFVE